MKNNNNLFIARKMLTDRITSIPKENKSKFFNDLLKLVEEAHTGGYESVYIGRK